MPDLFHYWLTGNARCEFTNATTTQMVNAGVARLVAGFDGETAASLGPARGNHRAGIDRGNLVRASRPARALAGTPVIAPGSHDTASAVAAIEARDGTAFLSSGTWSLIGTEVDAPLITAESLRLNFTNEGGVCGTTRLLKNVMGLWMLQGCRQAWSSQGQRVQLCELMDACVARARIQASRRSE